MKTLAIVLSIFALVCCAGMTFTLKGEQYPLNSIQSVRHGLTEAEVIKIMGDQMTVIPADQAPQWIDDATPGHDNGVFRYYYMGFPPQNMIIYFDNEGRVVYTTWAPT